MLNNQLKIAVTSFVVGGVIGLLIGFWYSDQQKQLVQSTIENTPPARVEKIVEKSKPKENTTKAQLPVPKSNKDKQTRKPTVDSLIVEEDNTTQDTTVFKDSLQSITLITIDSTTILEEVNYEDSISYQIEQDVVVRKEKLIASKNIRILNLKDSMAGEPSGVDSIITQESGMSESEEVTEYIVEFWQSPINYRGYKLANHKVLLYGVSYHLDSLALLKLGDTVYLKNNADIYVLRPTFAFKPFEQLTNQKLLAKLRE